MIETDYGSSKTITLPDFIRQNQREIPDASGKLSDVLLSIALGTKVVSQGVNRAGLAALLGLTGDRNVQGEEVQKLDLYSDRVFSRILGKTGDFFSMVSEERDTIFSAKAARPESKYVIAFDPLDGSSNIDVNVSIGSIWSIHQRLSQCSQVDPSDMRDFLQTGRKQIAAGYAIYGSSTMFVFTTGEGVHGFTLDPIIGEFILTHPDMKIPETGTIYSCNQGNFMQWREGVRSFIKRAQDGEVQPSGVPLKLRYVGSLVADFHRTLLKGGIFLYPADRKNPSGKLRLLYECAPLALLAEQAGGVAITGEKNVLDVVPEDIHQRVPFFFGSKALVKEFEGCLASESA